MTNAGVNGWPSQPALAGTHIVPPAAVVTSTTGGVAWYSANRMNLMRFPVHARTSLAAAQIECTVSSGNIEVAIYSVTRTATLTSFNLAKLGGSGVIPCPSTGNGNVSNSIWVPFASSLTLNPGQYAIGLWCDNTTAAFAHVSQNGVLRSGYCLSDVASSSGGAAASIVGTTYGGRAFGCTIEAAI